MNYKYLVTDIDDTLLNDNYEVSEENRIAIKKFMGKGGIFSLASGRMFESVKFLADDLDINGEIICYQGAAVCDKNGNFLLKETIPVKKAKEIIEYIESFGYYVQAYWNGKVHTKQVCDISQEYEKLCLVNMDYTGKLLSESLDERYDVIKILAVININDFTVDNYLNETFKDVIKCTRSKPIYLEIINKNTNKGKAVEEVAKMHGIKPDEIIAIGDGENDIPMIRSAGLGVAVDNARDIVKKEANYISVSNNKHAIAQIIKEFVLDE